MGRAVAAAIKGRGRVERERRDVARALAELPAGRGIEELGAEDDRRLGSWALCEALLERSRGLRHRDPGQMVMLARLAQIAAEALCPRRYGAGPVCDLQARAWAELANALRVADDLPAAREAMAVAVRRCEQGTGDPLVLGRVMDLTASLRSAERRFPEAIELLDEAYGLYAAVGEPHLAGRALISKGVYTGYRGDAEAAIDLLRQGLALIEPEREPKLVLTALQGMAAFLVECGRFREARRLVWRGGLWRLAGSDGVSRAKLRWLEAKIDAGLGRLDRAVEALLAVREELCRAGLLYKQALASLDLATVRLRQGRAAEVPPLVEEMIAAFRALGIGREALAALGLLAEACARRSLTVSVLDGVAGYLRRLEHDPALPFELPR